MLNYNFNALIPAHIAIALNNHGEIILIQITTVYL